MASYKIEGLSFTYPTRTSPTLSNITLTINRGEFITLCGASGCGKTTLLRLMKPSLSPFGNIQGEILFDCNALNRLDAREQAEKIGFVLQSPDSQIVTDKVWHELAFGLESLGYSTREIRTKVSEMASFFGIESWFDKRVSELSGGQKQLLNLASVMVMQPSVLILDEPTGQLDPIAAQEFLNTLKKINQELGTTVILSEHRLEEALPISQRVLVMDSGKIIADGSPKEVCKKLKAIRHGMYSALPAPMRIYGQVDDGDDFPLTVCEGRRWLEEYANKYSVTPVIQSADSTSNCACKTALEIKDLWFRYEKNSSDVIKGLNIKVDKGTVYSIVGGNGTGKTTALSLMAGLYSPQRGKIEINGLPISKIETLYNGVLGILPQNPQTVFVKKTVRSDLAFTCSRIKAPASDAEKRIQEIAELCQISNLLDMHPYDLSGGEQQRAALAKVLINTPEILLLDEPTKGMDAQFKEVFAQILQSLKERGTTVIMVSHDIEFCARVSDKCGMFFSGSIAAEDTPSKLFSGNSFYTTSTNRMARGVLPNAVFPQDVIQACGGKPISSNFDFDVSLPKLETEPKQMKKERKAPVKKLSTSRKIAGIVLILLCALLCTASVLSPDFFDSGKIKLVSSLLFIAGCIFLFPHREISVSIQTPADKRHITKRTLLSALFVLIAVPLTIYIGYYYLADRKYYFISLMIILETLVPFCYSFEGRKPRARELVIISVLCALAVSGRIAFFILPEFKPVLALVIISGICFGGESGFLVGAMTAFASNFFFGQGPWTPWQMFGFGAVGFISGILFRKGLLRKTRTSLSIYGFFATLVIYGGILNPASVLMMQQTLTMENIIAAFSVALPLDALHGLSTSFFLWFISETVIEKLERIKVKYGLSQ